MTAIEAIEQLKRYFDRKHLEEKEFEAVNMAFEALEKRVPQKVKPRNRPLTGQCPNCDALFNFRYVPYCPSCGQALDWSVI